MTTPPGEGLVPGDPFGAVKSDKKEPIGVVSPKEVNDFHLKSDADTSQQAQHHTIGLKHNQVSPGDHTHSGGESRRVGQGLKLTVTGSRAGNAALASLITQLAKVIDLTDSSTP